MKSSASNSKSKSPAGKNVEVRLTDFFPLFWEVDLNELDYKKDADFVISRVLDWGDYKNAWDNLELLYPKDLIQYYCVHQAQIFGNENIERLANKFGLKPGAVSQICQVNHDCSQRCI